jgi:hypothetical protein
VMPPVLPTWRFSATSAVVPPVVARASTVTVLLYVPGWTA